MRPHPKEILECCNAISEVLSRQFDHLSPPDHAFALEMVRIEYVLAARELYRASGERGPR